MELRELAGLGGVPVVIALVAVVNTALVLDKRWSPLLAIALGVAWQVGIALTLGQPAYGEPVLWGVLTGLAASGLFSGGKAIAGR